MFNLWAEIRLAGGIGSAFVRSGGGAAAACGQPCGWAFFRALGFWNAMSVYYY